MGVRPPCGGDAGPARDPQGVRVGPQAFSERYFELFEAVCGEVQNAEHDDEADGGA